MHRKVTTGERFVEIQKFCYQAQSDVATSPLLRLQGSNKVSEGTKEEDGEIVYYKKTYFLDAREATVGP